MTATPLERELLGTIRAEGPLALDRFMALCLNHARYGYYMTRDPFGVAGDFVTAPEVTQMFGEMVGVWCASVFELMDRPDRLDLIELGPGRGTLMADILRSVKVMPGLSAALRVRLVEASPRLRQIQNVTLRPRQTKLSWHDTMDEIGAGPAIVIANEFFDALPVKQFRRWHGEWSERVVEAGSNGLCLGWARSVPAPAGQIAECTDGDVLEVRPAADELAAAIAGRLMNDPGAALVVDYGHLRSSPGDTLQAVRRHRMVPILDRPGESDLTAHVDFESLGKALAARGARVWAPLSQRQFLLGMGLELRAQRLKNDTNGAQAGEIDQAFARIAGPDRMGNLFKVIAATSPGLSRPHPFVSEMR